MKKFKLLLLISLLICYFFFINKIYLFKNIYNDDRISIVINFKNLTRENILYFDKVIQILQSTRNFYFIKTSGYSLNNNLTDLIKSNLIKIVQSNFPDSLYLQFVVSLYGNTNPEFVLFIEGDELICNSEKKLIKWIDNAYKKIKIYNYDYIFGNSQIISGKKIGCSIILSKASIIQHLLYTDSDTTHINPFIQFSYATQTKFIFMPFNYIQKSNLENVHNRFSINMKCPQFKDDSKPSLCIVIPAFKRNYFSSSFTSFSKQTYKPKFYVIIQNDNRKLLNLSLIQKIANKPVYYIWIKNWNSFFYLNHRLSSVFPCDFILKYDDDQWPKDDNLQDYLIKKIKNKNEILGFRGFTIRKTRCGYTPKYFKIPEKNVRDHVATPFLVRRGYFKLDARNEIFRITGSEDIALSLNSFMLCNVTSKITKMNLFLKQNDGNSQALDNQIKYYIQNSKDSKILKHKTTYCFLIHSGYIPISWEKFKIPIKDYINVTINHKGLFNTTDDMKLRSDYYIR